jgi:hypothetical protein
MKISNIFLVTALVCLNGEVANADIAYYLDTYIGTDRVLAYPLDTYTH